MRTRVLLLVVALVAAVCGVAGIGASAASASTPPPTPVVSGNQLVDSSTGRVFVPHGANWSSFEYACSEGWGYSVDSDTAAAASAMESWGITIVRIPLNEECWLGSDPSDDYGSASGYRAAVAAWVGILNAHGIVAILDLHWSAPPGQRALGQWPMADSQSATFWTSVATAYAGNPSVMFDLFNEPYSISNGNAYTFQLTWDCWENGGCQAPYVDENQEPITGDGSGTYTVVGMSALVAAVRAAGASQPILLGGLDYSNNLSGWLAHEPSDPDHQLVASWHNYDGQNPDCNTTSCWNSTILPVAASVPVMATEFGETDGKTAWFTSFMDWADANGIGYSPWAWTDATQTSGDDATYSLYTGNNFAPNAPMGTAYKAHLATLQPVVFRIQPAPMTAPGFPIAAAPASPSAVVSSAVVSSAITPGELRQLLESSRRQLRIAPR